MKLIIANLDYEDPIANIEYEKEAQRRAHRRSRKTKREVSRTRHPGRAGRYNGIIDVEGIRFCKRMSRRGARANYLAGIEDDTYSSKYQAPKWWKIRSIVWDQT